MNSASAHHFNLTALVDRQLEMDLPSIRMQWIAFSALGILLGIVGVYVGVTGRLPEGAAAIAVGAALVLAAWFFYQSAQHRPNQLEVTESMVRFWRMGRSSGTEIRWDSPHFRLILVNRGGSGHSDRLGTNSLFIGTRNSPSLPVPRAAFDLILNVAHSRGLTVKQQTIGSADLIVIKSPSGSTEPR